MLTTTNPLTDFIKLNRITTYKAVWQQTKSLQRLFGDKFQEFMEVEE
jgi:hypothetical protein